MSKRYRECQRCHAHLDFGEQCDCMQEKEKKEKRYEKLYRTDPVTCQIILNLESEE